MKSKERKTPEAVGSLSRVPEDAGVGALSSPLDLQRRLLRPQVRLDFVPFLDFFAILLIFGLLNAEFIFAPGLSVDLPESRSSRIEGVPASAVLTLRSNMVLFEGARYTLGNLEQGFRSYFAGPSAPDSDTSAVLLLKMDRQVDMQQFLAVCEIARSAGFSRIQVAALPDQPEGGRGFSLSTRPGP